jgi:glutamate--cysteine ligase
MSTLTGEQESKLIESEEELYSFFQKFAKPATDRRIGMECEFFGVDRETGKALPYLGPRGIEAVLCRLAAAFHYEPILEEGHVIALRRGETWITLEPGGQVELSAPPVRTVFEVEKQIATFAHELGEMKNYFRGIAWLSAGIQPFSSLDEIPWVPKRRYELMSAYFKSHGGPLAHEMMKRTATNQVSLDFPDEATALAQFRVIFGITSIVSALFAHAAFSEGRPNGFLTRRLQIWNETDSDRSGLLVQFVEGGKSFRDYVEFLLEMPLIFIVRDELWIPMEGISFRKFLRGGKSPYRATWSDFELHLTTAFPEARFKHYLEIRGVDAQRIPLIPSVAAFWKGILYDEEIRDQAWNLVSNLSPKDRLRLHQAVPKEGLKARMGPASIFEIAEKLYHLSCEGLGRQAAQGEKSECVYLDRLKEEILTPRRTPAETLLEKWNGEFHQKPDELLRYLEI